MSAVAAVWLTLDARFLAHPGWLAVQKADFILGPIGVGLYWRHRRPDNRLGLLLIALGLLGVPYVLESTSAPWPFTIGTLSEYLIVPMTFAVILAFPSGRLDGVAARLIVAVAVVWFPVNGLLYLVIAPQYTPYLSISGCRVLCPANPLFSSAPAWGGSQVDVARAMLVAFDLAAAGLLVWRFATGTPPRRRALAIGAPIALCFLLIEATYQTLQLINPNYAAPNAEPLGGPIQWAIAASRSTIWYGFLFALIAAEAFAGRALRALVSGSLGRPSFHGLEGMLRGPLGDPGLRLGLWDARSSGWADADGAAPEPPGRGQTFTPFERDGTPAAILVHDAQLAEDPELLRAAGAVVLLAVENAELDAAWKESLDELAESRDELADSRARLLSAGARERRKLERDLHDGAQQRLVAASINLSLASELPDGDPSLKERVVDACVEVEEALTELREVAHGIYPPALGRWGLVRALDLLVARYPDRVTVAGGSVGRFSSEVEAAIYYCCTEAVQNALKHAGAEASISIRLYTDANRLHLEVRDDGPGFDLGRAHGGIGLQNMRDRVGAVGGHLEIVSTPGQGTLVAATAPVSGRSGAGQAELSRAQ